MRARWVLFLLLLALIVSAGIGTANLMWGKPPHVVEESRLGDRYPLEERATDVYQPLEVVSGEEPDAV